jgi:hypothetical protein
MNYLVLIGHVEILPSLYSHVVIPQATGKRHLSCSFRQARSNTPSLE